MAGRGIALRLAAALFAGLVLVGTVGGCASNGTQTASAEDDGIFGPDNDPLEFVNRFTFAINDAIDTVIVRPIAVTYRFWVPEPVRNGVRNVLRNLNAPVVLANDILQWEWDRAETTFMRFIINSTIGVAGIFDVASDWGYEYHSEDFGQTLATWGIGEGFYLVLPLIGPSSARDGVGLIVDSYMDPWPYVLDYATNLSDDTITYISIGRLAVEGIDIRSRNLETLDEVRKDAVDYYARLRSLYRQNRLNEIRNGELEEIPLPGLTEEDWLKDVTPVAAGAVQESRQENR